MLLRRLCLTFVAIVSMAVACVAADAVRPVRNDLKVEDLGTPVQRRASWSLVYKAAPTDETHVFVTLTAGSGYGTDPTCEVVDFNLGTGEVVKATGPKGGTYLRPGCVHPNGKMYCTTTRPVSLLEFDPGAKKFRIVGKLAGFYNTIHDVALAPDGVIFFGHNGRQLTSYDPKADKTGDHGIMGGEPASTNQLKVFNGPSPWDFRKIDQRFCPGPDGCGWLFIDNHLTRIHPDGTVEKLQELKQTGQLFFTGDDLYIYNGGRDVFGGFAGVLRIKGVFAEM